MVKVQDDGPGLPAAGAPQGRGIGLANTRARLGQLYGDAAELTVENGEQGGAVATMVLPYRLAVVFVTAHDQYAIQWTGTCVPIHHPREKSYGTWTPRESTRR
jgi:hypothetical protein